MFLKKYTIIPSNFYLLTLIFTVVYLLGGEVVLYTKNFIFLFIKYVSILLQTVLILSVYSKYNVKWRLIITFSLLLSLIVGLINGRYFELLATCVLVFGAKGQNYRNVLRYYFSISAFFCISVIFLCKLGIIRDNVAEPLTRINFLTGADSIRHSFGYVWPTNLSTHVFFILLSLWIYKKGHLNIWHFIFYIIISYLLLIYTDSRLGAGCILLLPLFSLFIYARDKMDFRFSKWNLFYVIWIPCISIVMIYVTQNYDASNSLWVLLNTLFSGRLRIGHEAMTDYGTKLFGQLYVQYGGQNAGDYYNFIDSSYIQLVVIYGIVYTALFIIAFIVVAYKAYKRKDMVLLLAIFVAGISGAIAQHFLQIYMNPLLLALTTKHDRVTG